MISFDCVLKRGDFTLDAAFEGDAGVTALFGRSGSGKSTIIRLIAGLEQPQSGRICLDDHVLLDTMRGVQVMPHRRNVGMVFQDAQLFPHLSVYRNLLYGRYFAPFGDRRISLDAVLGVLGIEHLLSRLPRTLSGGERQRVAIGRALLRSPRLLLMDEPLAALDAERKLEILPFVERLRDEFNVPIIYVSHAVEEVARLASRVVKISEGRVVANGSPETVLSPAEVVRASERFDVLSTLTAHIERYDDEFGVTYLRHPAGTIVVPGRLESSAPVRIGIRATNVTLAVGRPGQLSIRTALNGRIQRVEQGDGPFALVVLELAGGDRLLSCVTRLALADMGLDEGDTVHALLKAVAISEAGVSGFKVVKEKGK